MKIKNRVLITFLCFLIINTFTFNLFTLGENKWDRETAQELMNYDWNKAVIKDEEPVIIFYLRLEKLSTEFVNTLAKELKVNVSDNLSNNLDIKISTDESILDLVDDYKLTFTNNITDYPQFININNDLDTWLTTVGEQPVSLILNEKQVKEDNELYKLELKLGVKSIDLLNKKILTAINLEFLNSSSQLTNTSTKVWVDNKEENPIAVLSKKEKYGDRYQTSYYALYLTASIISADKLVEKTPLITAGNIQGLNNLFSSSDNQYNKPNREVSLALSNNYIAINARDNSLIKKNLDLAYKYDGEYIYDLGLEYPFFQGEELYLAGNIGNKLREKPIIQLGLSDSVKVNNFEYKLTYLPLSTDLSGNTSVIDEIKLELINDDLNFWYKNLSSDTREDELGLRYNINSDFGVSAVYDKGEEEELSIGIIWRFYHEDS